MIYLMSCKEFVKIGYSKNPEKRLNGVQTGNPHEVTLDVVFDGGAGTEREVQKHFSRYHYRNEWFELRGELLDFWQALKDGAELPPTTPRALVEIIRGEKYLCPSCKNKINQNRGQTKVYCSEKCKAKAYRARLKKGNPPLD